MLVYDAVLHVLTLKADQRMWACQSRSERTHLMDSERREVIKWNHGRPKHVRLFQHEILETEGNKGLKINNLAYH